MAIKENRNEFDFFLESFHRPSIQTASYPRTTLDDFHEHDPRFLFVFAISGQQTILVIISCFFYDRRANMSFATPE